MSDILRFPPPSNGQKPGQKTEPPKPGNRKQESEAAIARRRALDNACAESRRRLMGFPASEIGVDRLVLVGSRSATLLCPPLAAAGGHMLVRFQDGRKEALWLPTGLATHPGAPPTAPQPPQDDPFDGPNGGRAA
ncbi:MAG: hypothetical protein RIB41_09945 [Oceanibaculum nanhaiense]|uniref:hypothetical protein n=1 Tax=Oceanibaculum nanhaiense TaxID=1909734 RepID=UPI0032ED2210